MERINSWSSHIPIYDAGNSNWFIVVYDMLRRRYNIHAAHGNDPRLLKNTGKCVAHADTLEAACAIAEAMAKEQPG